MFRKLFGGGSTPPKTVPDPLPEARSLLLLPETEQEWAPVRAADFLGGESLLIAAALIPRLAPDLKQARIDRKQPSGEIKMEDMGGGTFTCTLSSKGMVSETTLDALKSEASSGEPFPVMLYAMYDGRTDVEQGLMVFHVTYGGLGVLPPNDYSQFNNLFLNLELRTGLYACCNARFEREKSDLVIRLDLARYEVCYNRCQRVLHERNAGAMYQ